jgi:FkbM family methyltransferase
MIDYINTVRKKTTIEPNFILEIGSRDGHDSEELRKEFNIEPSNVWVVEPNPKQQVKISEKYPNFNLITSPIFNVEKKITFFRVDVENETLVGVSSLLDRVDKLYDKINTDRIELETILGSTLLGVINKPIDLCKIDVEGATFEVLESFGEEIKKIKSIHIECEHRIVWENQKLYDEVKSYLISKEFTQLHFEYCNQATLQSDSVWVQKSYIK